MKKFWLVWCVDAGMPRCQHFSHESACFEAERLARQHPGKRFEVMERVASVIKQDVVWEGEIPMPF